MLGSMKLFGYRHTFENLFNGLCKNVFIIERLIETTFTNSLRKQFANMREPLIVLFVKFIAILYRFGRN